MCLRPGDYVSLSASYTNATPEIVSCPQPDDAQVKKLLFTESFGALHQAQVCCLHQEVLFCLLFFFSFPDRSEYQHRAALTCGALGLRDAEHEEEKENSRWPHGKGLSLNQPRDRRKEEGHVPPSAPTPAFPAGRTAVQRGRGS